jgi:glucosamine--fructose-6-phosphate aminotransferase (isomerizing)
MCSIIAYKGNKKASSIIINALKKMEYRGYDSVGIATLNNDKIFIKKGVGKVEDVNKRLNLIDLDGNIGIGHTRWATHGNVTDANAHPHSACNNYNIAIVHNGKIDNYEELRIVLKDHKFTSQTDSEVIAHLLEENLKNNDLKNALINTCKSLKGGYAFVAIINDIIVGARRDEPLLIGIDKDNYYIASDVLAFIEYTDKVIFLDNNEILILDNKLEIYNLEGENIKKNATQIAWEFADFNKGEYAHYTLKEIDEQSITINRVFTYDYGRILDEFVNEIIKAKKVLLIASGSSYNAALLAKILLTRVNINCEAIIASECQYYRELFNDALLLTISQSGETRDVLRAVDYAKIANAKVLSIVNVKTSTLARVSDLVLSINCGPEIGVAATKSFTAQLGLFYRIVDKIKGINLDNEINLISYAVNAILKSKDTIKNIASSIKDASDIYILGRGLHYPIALEGALKIKELAYIHAEGMPAGEFRHGPLALIDNKSVVIILNPKDDTYNDMISNAYEIKARKAQVIGISDQYSNIYDYSIIIPMLNKLYPLINVIPLQLLAYYLALERNHNPDYPRNLAKSVTVD